MPILMQNLANTSGTSVTVLLPAIGTESGQIKQLEGGKVESLCDGCGGCPAGIDEAMENSSDNDVGEVYSTMSSSAPNFSAVCSSPGASGASSRSSNTAGWRKKWPNGELARAYRGDPESPSVVVLKSKTPQWNGALRAHRSDFHGRTVKASKENFGLVAVSDSGKVSMLFGKHSDDRFALDFRHPPSGLQAVAIMAT
ncbi:hypothetical protein CUR178_04803 [Leishmania enriettii]|uniref:Tubby C-terminal domain-containing protein n=1 Tax=Leishmania enriettii TaxID=5663 RepID=A0A836GZU2_LEIEN|nr:hypothetical protein CUR178_04803 [Leishmania enriettii]